MVAQHTPGPWKIHGENGTTVYAHDYGTEVCAVSLTVLRGKEEYEANARLIAAAPEMLAALRQSLGTLRGRKDDAAITVCDIVRAAIAKAEER